MRTTSQELNLELVEGKQEFGVGRVGRRRKIDEEDEEGSGER